MGARAWVMGTVGLMWATIGARHCAAAEPGAGFDKDIQPLLKTYCFQCHGPEKAKGDVNFSTFAGDGVVERDPKLWGAVLDQLNDRNMPPRKKPQPTAAERERITLWLHDSLAHLDFSKLPKDPGRVTLHRLNRAEYNNTVRDLLGVHTHPADAFPADGAGGGGFDNNADTLFIPPLLMEQYLAAASEVLRVAPADRLFTAKPSNELSSHDAAKQIIERFATRTFRRPVRDDEVDRYLHLFDTADARGDGFENSVRMMLKAALVSPQFLFRVEADHDTKEPYPISDYELASRLSYFLWSSMPDDELFDLAGKGKLHEDEVLEQQVRRMLKDAKSQALAENFGGQWLTFRDLRTTAQPDRKRFREFTPAVRDAMYDESVLFVDSVFREDKSVLTLIDADYTYLNEALARHYGIPNVSGEDMRRVTLPDHNRGGILGLGSILTVTSYPLRTSPVLRGKWVLEAVLGAPPPPPPADVPQLPKDDQLHDGLTFRQRLEQHRADPTCAACHARMDPIGFGMENFDAVGRWRTQQAGKDVDAAGVLVTGETFSGPAELKMALLLKKDAFTRNLTEKLLSYAIGRGLEYYDQPAVAQISQALAEQNDSATALVAGVVKSYPFRYRRDDRTAAPD
jgi:Protein of unknown function (DUF1592)/Protein of unknown function (DUF1588)/Protein of unknown function (DUF1587)/Protein of unknown function (DUF1585)/Protein of unknown function (DUF1595)/Planctomycete cytochrome C